MAGRIVLVFFGMLCGVIIAMALISLIIAPTLISDPKSLGDISNFVMAVGAVFTLGFTLWQHQQTLDRDRKHAQPRMRLIGAPLHQVASAEKAMIGIVLEFQFINDSKNPASNLRIRIIIGPLGNPELMAVAKDETMANPVFGGQGFHWVLKADFAKAISPKDNEYFVYARLEYRDTDEAGEELSAEYFLKINHSEDAIANATMREVEPYKSKIRQLL